MNEARLPAEVATEAKLTPVPLVALVRGAGHVIDLFSIALVVLIPLFYHTAAREVFNSIDFSFDVVKFLSKSYGTTTIGLALVLTPLPIIYLRLFFKRLMKTPTPGETIAGITSYSTASGIEGVIQESLYGLSQYVISIFAAVFACIATCALWGVPCVILEIIAPGAKAEEFLGSYSITIAAAYLAVCFALSFVAAVGFGFVPHSREDVASFFDECCQLEVKRLR
ncbi:hypothetical protein KA344_08940 [bacterium]|jgi:hypothetical protein|nr:hypothetical protein [bacterium]